MCCCWCCVRLFLGESLAEGAAVAAEAAARVCGLGGILEEEWVGGVEEGTEESFPVITARSHLSLVLFCVLLLPWQVCGPCFERSVSLFDTLEDERDRVPPTETLGVDKMGGKGGV